MRSVKTWILIEGGGLGSSGRGSPPLRLRRERRRKDEGRQTCARGSCSSGKAVDGTFEVVGAVVVRCVGVWSSGGARVFR